jgi:hypothetical protein
VDVFSWNGAYIAPNDWYSRVHLLAGDISLRPAYKMRFSWRVRDGLQAVHAPVT